MSIEELIKNQIADLDITQMVKVEIKKLISDDVKREINKQVIEGVKSIVTSEVEIILSKGITTDDGWGNKGEYESFESLFKNELHKKINSTYEIGNLAKKYITSEVKKLVDLKTKDITQALLNSLNK